MSKVEQKLHGTQPPRCKKIATSVSIRLLGLRSRPIETYNIRSREKQRATTFLRPQRSTVDWMCRNNPFPRSCRWFDRGRSCISFINFLSSKIFHFFRHWNWPFSLRILSELIRIWRSAFHRHRPRINSCSYCSYYLKQPNGHNDEPVSLISDQCLQTSGEGRLFHSLGSHRIFTRSQAFTLEDGEMWSSRQMHPHNQKEVTAWNSTAWSRKNVLEKVCFTGNSRTEQCECLNRLW